MTRVSAGHVSGLLWRRLHELAEITDEPGKLTRTFLSAAMRRANTSRADLEAAVRVRIDFLERLANRHGGS